MRNLFSCFLTFFLFQLTYGQQDSASQAGAGERKTSALKFDVHYLSNNVYQGRKDSATIPYLLAGVTYVSRLGFYAAANLSYVTTDARIDAYTLEAGYEFSIKKINGGVSVNRSSYNAQSTNVKAEVGTSLSAYASWDFSVVQPTLSGSLIVGHNKPDYVATLGLEHRFATENEAFAVTPGFSINASTQNYYDSYYGTRRIARGKKKGVAVTTTAEVLDAAKFKVLDYELSANVEYKAKNLSLYFEPTYAMAENPAVVVVTTKGPLGSTSKSTREKIGNSFYATLGVTYSLPLAKH